MCLIGRLTFEASYGSACAGSALDQFAALRDPWQAAKVLHPLPERLFLLLCGTVAGADDCVELTLWGREHLAFLRRFLPFAHGLPSHDTLCEVIAAIDPVLFKTCDASADPATSIAVGSGSAKAGGGAV